MGPSARKRKPPPGKPKVTYLDAAVIATLDGEQVAIAETSAAAGCRIKFNPKKDD